MDSDDESLSSGGEGGQYKYCFSVLENFFTDISLLMALPHQVTKLRERPLP